MATRMQVTLDREQHHRAGLKAAALGMSFAEYIRRLVAADLADQQQDDGDISEIFGIGDSGGGDVARDGDDHLAQALSEAHANERSHR